MTRSFADVAQALLVTVIGVLPPFLVGTLASDIGEDLSVGPAKIGIATALMFAISAIVAKRFGRWAQRIGPRPAMMIASAFSGLAMCGVAVASSFLVLLSALAVGGLGNALAQPTANLTIVTAIKRSRLGAAFGIKQSSIPLATLFCGVSVPALSLTVGWRFTFAVGAVIAFVILLWSMVRTPQKVGVAVHRNGDGLPRHAMLLLTIGGGLGTAASSSLGVFMVVSGVRSGLSPTSAGFVLAACSLAGLGGRIWLGWLVDRHPAIRIYKLIANLLGAGAVGYVLLGSDRPGAFVVGAVIAYCAGWTWVGLVHLVVVRNNPASAASATGAVQVGLSMGAAAGPLSIGLIIEATSYSTAWLVAGLLSAGASLAVAVGRRSLK